MERQNDAVGILVLRQGRSPVEEGHLEQNDRKYSKEGGGRIVVGLFDHQPELWEGEQMEPVIPLEKWETVTWGQWMQRTVWNRIVTRPVREQPHTTRWLRRGQLTS